MHKSQNTQKSQFQRVWAAKPKNEEKLADVQRLLNSYSYMYPSNPFSELNGTAKYADELPAQSPQ